MTFVNENTFTLILLLKVSICWRQKPRGQRVDI